MTNLSPTLNSAKITLTNGIPSSEDFADIYFSPDDGVAESHYNFIEGNQLPQRFAALSDKPFVIVETGFGTGLNALLAAKLWQQTAPSSRQLHYISTEKYPISPHELAAIYQANHWDNELSQALLAAYPPLQTGQYTLPLAANIHLTLLWGDATEQLQAYDCCADAFFLDGFAPDKNPDMWSQALFTVLRKRSTHGTTFATFTAAGHVRRGLASVGFSVQKAKGFGRKRERLLGKMANHQL